MMERKRLDWLLAETVARFGAAGGLYRAPGRVNLIGDHTDYQDGVVLPIAIDRDIWCAATRRGDRLLQFVSLDLGESARVPLDDLRPEALPHWARYPAGVAWALQHEGHALSGADLLFQSTLPIGAGLSSSAALELASALALEFGSGFTVAPKNNALLCRRAENEFVGVPCGIMDQYVGALGVAGHALLIDCRHLTHRPVPIPADAAIVVLESGVRHHLAASAYHQRRAETEQAVTLLRQRHPEVRALRDVTQPMLTAAAAALPPVIQKRARHVVSENARVFAAADALEAGDLIRFGELMNQSHQSLRDDFEVSTPEIDLLVEAARAAGALGARITGGGFGGAAVALVRGVPIDQFCAHVTSAYRHATGRAATVFVVRPAAGAGPLVLEERGDRVRTRTYRLPDGRFFVDYRFDHD
ncbi:MAG: galactokinase [Chloroflexota bacterium]|nr:galactokinase [Dehalococcoidia bacterium]MDW8253422.1 galactokinase [Chloroflexota bacterium]